ncbi:uncharacterized protein LOC110978161 isoform X3 [Acanthaster planci]|uniref:Uncharacterized protein LOC110978161 isoform X3 n=1 Tax=Acanthaster planci TaxID=133434 RepID=A0A8B7Y5Z4_ACAPL|nr:uncharacterized protein LOC110978161 isoform X3 [Acanthaster planci]
MELGVHVHVKRTTPATDSSATSAIEVSEENFEALLVYDDLFLDYFNAFLQLPAFPQPLYYNRLTGTFQEVDDDGQKTNSALASLEEGIPGSRLQLRHVAAYAPGDEERERILDWAKKERLPLFLRTKLFLEYKLCKLLLRPLDERRPTSRQNSSRGLRGYSRQTTSFTSTSASLAQSREPSMYDNEGSDYAYWLDENERMAMFRYLRPGSRCISLPPMLDIGPSSPMWNNEVHSEVPAAVTNDSHRDAAMAKPSSKSASGRRSAGKVNPLPPHPQAEPTENGWVGDMAEFTEDVQQRLSLNGDAESSCKQDGGAASRKSALRSPGIKGISPKKKTTILIPNTDDTLSNTLEESSSTFQFLDRVPSPSDDYAVHPPAGSSIYQTPLEQSLLAGDAEDEEDAATATASVIEYDDEEDERTESELREMEGRHRVTFQQLKEHIIGSFEGMTAFKSFLSDTAGEDMMNFWLDCELYSDNVQAIHMGESATNPTMTRLFRDIQDKYKFNLTSDAKEQIKRAQGNTGLSESVFTRTQYDVLRRLRSYWVARFVLHKERMGDLSPEKHRSLVSDMDRDPKTPQLSFLPSISLVNSLPVRPSSCFRLASTARDWSRVATAGRRMEDVVRPGRLVDLDAVPYVPRPLSARFHIGLACDREAGRPFQRHLEKQVDRRLLANLLFWQDVTDYGVAEDRAADRLLRMGHAWSIFNKFIMDGGMWNIGIDPYERDNIHRRLLTTSDFVEASTFNRAKEHAVLMLQREWLMYLKEDLKEFLQCRSRPEDRFPSRSSHRSSAKSAVNEKAQSSRQVHFALTKASTASKTPKRQSRSQRIPSKAGRARRKGRELSPESKKKAQQKKRKEQLAMQRKLLRQVKKARAEAKKKPGVKFQTDQEPMGKGDGAKAGGNKGGVKGKEEAGVMVPQIQTYQPPDAKVPEESREDATFKKMAKNKQLMTLFKNYMQEIEGKENLSAFNMYFDIEAALRLPDAHAEKRYNLAKQISSTYFDPSSKKAIDLSHDILTRLSNEGDRPTVKTLEAAQKHVIPKLEQVFSNFWIIYDSTVYQTEADSVDKIYLSTDEVQMLMVLTSKAHTESMDDQGGGGGDSKFDMALRSGSTQSLVLAWKRRRRGKGPHSGQQMPTSQDKNEFQSFLLKAARGVPPEKMIYFHRYLMEYGEKDAMPLLEKDLVFYLEVQRFKESHHTYSDMFMLKRKVEVIVDCFIDSPVTNPGLQIDVPPEVASKLLKQTDNYLKDKGKDPHNPTLFDDAQYTVFKEMLPYWSSFTRRFKEYHDKNPRLPSTKIQKLTKQRLKKFLEMKEPRRDFKLPSVATAPQSRTGGTGITFSISEGLQWKNFEYSDVSDGTVSPTQSRRASSIDSSMAPQFHRLRVGTNRSGLASQDSTSTKASRSTTSRVGVTA